MILKLLVYISLGVTLTSLFSCNTYEKLVYFQDPPTSIDSLTWSKSFTPTLKIDDFLSITVLADDPTSTIPFNLPNNSTTRMGGYTSGIPSEMGYLIDEAGNINMPILGEVKVGGLTRIAAIKKIEEILADYLQNPVVNIRIQNFKITVLGEVRTPGTFQIPNERISLIEAIGLAGDLSPTGVRKNIRVIRDVNGHTQQFYIDLTSSDLFHSEVYYLQQNDVVYVEPNSTSRYKSTIIPSIAPVILSVTSLIISTATLILR